MSVYTFHRKEGFYSLEFSSDEEAKANGLCNPGTLEVVNEFTKEIIFTEKKIIKAEILWSRDCSLGCSYCAMADGRRNTISEFDWEMGFYQLKKLGCSFAAFYGAEPLNDFEKLPNVIEYAESIGIHTTVITSGVTPYLNNKLRILYEHGLRSITTSYDMVSLGNSSAIKSAKAMDIINQFRSFGTTRDAAIVATLTRTNFKLLPETIKKMSDKNIWTFFDLIHPDRHQPGSKVKNTEHLLFRQEDLNELNNVLAEVLSLKKEGYLCHTSESFIKHLSKLRVSTFYTWCCAEEDNFPAFITIDCDGLVYPCDDFQPKEITNIKIWEIADRWEEFCSVWKKEVIATCPGCCWNTHLDAHAIKRNELPITDYIHGMENK